jgi:hypothetical protein
MMMPAASLHLRADMQDGEVHIGIHSGAATCVWSICTAMQLHAHDQPCVMFNPMCRGGTGLGTPKQSQLHSNSVSAYRCSCKSWHNCNAPNVTSATSTPRLGYLTVAAA